MKCDQCKEDKCFWTELSWNKKYIVNPSNGHRIKMYVCEKCKETK